ncbi:MAG: OadG family transporter subunit [Gammaproteobacteria bacterium]
MLKEGLDLMVIGMGTVFVFLGVLVVCVQAMSAVIVRYSPAPRMPEPVIPPVKASPAQDELAAAMTAAIHHHRQRQ